MKGEQLGSREAVLTRIRRALAVPAPRPKAHSHSHATPNVAPSATPNGSPQFQSTLPMISEESKAWLPPVGADFDSWVELFAANSTDLRTEFVRVANEAELSAKLRAMKNENNWTRIGTHTGELTDLASQTLDLPLVQTDEAYDVNELEGCEVGITECDALVAQTGSVVMTTRSAGGRVLSILPPHHIVLARSEQMLPDLPTAFTLLQDRYGDNYPSLMGLITGPSRTGDIERILVLGAHGPKKLTVILMGE